MDYTKVAVVTGGAGGIGSSIALQLANDGLAVAIIDIDKKGADVAAKIDGITKGLFVEQDISDYAALPAVMDKIAAELGGIDVLVNCAGIMGGAPMEEVVPADFDKFFNVNVKGTFFVTQAAVKYLKEKKGNVLNIACARAHIATGEHAVYAAGAAAIVSMSREMAVDLSVYGIHVNSLSPWVTETPALGDKAKDPAWREHKISTTLMEDLIQPEDIAELASFLVSDDAYSIDAFDMIVDAGMINHRDHPTHSWFDPEGAEYYH